MAFDTRFILGLRRYQRVSPDYLPITNGRKSNSRTCKDDDPDTTRIPSFGVGGGNVEAKPLRIRSAWTPPSPNPDTTSSPVVVLPPQPETVHHSPLKYPIHENGAITIVGGSGGGGGDVLLQWGHKKRSRGARAESRTAADEASARQAAKIHRRSVAAASGLSEKLTAAAAMPPPPCSASYSRGENLRPSMPRWPPAPQLGRAMEDRSSRGGGGVHNKRSSPPTPPAQTKAAAACSIAGEKMMVNGSISSDREVGASASAHPAALGKVNMDLFEWPRIYISLSRKEKEDDFLVMKGTKLPRGLKRGPKT
ncbi:hypothetical protein QJS10_CPA03g00861 [Acorus calamus]|uniref:Uncharacterized protein n=1 Tax=Acorus calamus TaxID=4465 RepID=A0AAV9F4S6_ACOCL|nr:hypothetical protein QJS10_CPA03g00861 [Acorus calamus]